MKSYPFVYVPPWKLPNNTVRLSEEPRRHIRFSPFGSQSFSQPQTLYHLDWGRTGLGEQGFSKTHGFKKQAWGRQDGSAGEGACHTSLKA